MKVVIAGLDGTLLDENGSRLAAARYALDALRSRQVPLVLCTAKTREEAEYWRASLGTDAPFVVENGGAVYIPKGYFTCPIPASVQRSAYDVIEFGSRHAELVRILKAAARESGCRVRGFHDMEAQEIAIVTGLSLPLAALAKRREYSELFQILGSNGGDLLHAIEARGKHWVRGNRLYAIVGFNDSGRAVRQLADLYRRERGDVTTIGLGDGSDDVDFLKVVDIPVVIRSGASTRVRQEIPLCRVSASASVFGFIEAVLEEISVPGTRLGSGKRTAGAAKR